MARLPTIIRYRGAVYLQASVPEDIEAEMDRAVSAVGGKRTGESEGNAKDLVDLQRPWEVEVSAIIANLTPATKLSAAFPYSTIEWRGVITATMDGGSPVITAIGGVALDGLWYDDQARIWSDDDILRGEWDGENWTWSRDVRGAY